MAHGLQAERYLAGNFEWQTLTPMFLRRKFAQSIYAREVRFPNPLLTHWRGRGALLPTILFTALTLRLLIGWLQEMVPPDFLSVWLAASVGVFIWQVVGTSRLAERLPRRGGSVLEVLTTYFIVAVLAVLTFVQVADGLSSKQRAERYSIKTPMLPVLSSENVIRVDGNFDWELFGAFERTLADNPDVKNVRLGSTGGYVFVARAMALKIMELNLNTHVATHCFSACTVAFVAGEKRTMAETAKLGFHMYKLEAAGEVNLIDMKEELEKDRKFFAERGLSDDFIQHIFTADNSQLWMPDQSSLKEAGVLVY